MTNKQIVTYEDLKMKLRPAQRKAAELLVANDFAPKGEKKTLGEIAEEVGISQRLLYDWRQNPDFTRYMSAISDGELSNYRSLADSQLIKLIKGTSNNGIPAIKALELFYKLEGRLADRQIISTDETSPKSEMTREEVSKRLKQLDKIMH